MDILRYQWSDGNGQCPCCAGASPNVDWWVDYVGHELDCSLALTMELAGIPILWKQLNPDRAIGSYIGLDGGIGSIRASDSDELKDKKRNITKEYYRLHPEATTMEEEIKEIFLEFYSWTKRNYPNLNYEELVENNQEIIST
jgi:hypothetical protein